MTYSKPFVVLKCEEKEIFMGNAYICLFDALSCK